jgi:hypothetical protein
MLGMLFKMNWLERAKRNAIQNPITDTGSAPLVAGVDVGGGQSETVAYVCECKHEAARLSGWVRRQAKTREGKSWIF